jgi:hypothetical protein
MPPVNKRNRAKRRSQLASGIRSGILRALLAGRYVARDLALFGICLSGHAQFFGLATAADGSRVYFATPLRQKNTTLPQHGKLFQVDSPASNCYCPEMRSCLL